MVTRIVKMTFRTESCDEFLRIFHIYKEQIRTAEGCVHLSLLRQHQQGNVFFTYSKWISEEHLDKYRYSSIFAEVWPQTKALFESPAQAWTTEVVVALD